MIDILSITLPVYMIIVIGYVSVRFRYLDQPGIAALGRFTLRVSLPALIFSAIAFSEKDTAINWTLAIGYLLASLCVLAFGFVVMRVGFGQGKGVSWIHGLAMANSNSGFIGFSVASMVFPETALSVLAWIMIVENVVVIPLAIVLADISAGESRSLRQSVKKACLSFIKNPLVIAVALGLIVRLSGVQMPAQVQTTIKMLASVAPIIALFVVGGIVAQYQVSPYWRRTAVIAAGKLALHPIAVFVVLWVMLGADDPYMMTAVLFAAVPMLTIYPILGAAHDAEQVCATALIATTVLSFVTVSGLIWLLGFLGQTI